MNSLTEFELIERFFRRPARNAIVGVGDDAAVIAPALGSELAISTDMLVSGRHFFADANPEAIGHKTLAVNLSDMAAVGAAPRWALLAGALPDADTAWVSAFARGWFALADAHSVDLIGGDTTRGPLTLCVTILGELPRGSALLRSGARAGDAVWISGRLGDAALALAHLQHRAALEPDEFAACERALLWPVPRVALGLRLRGVATAAIDISDGLTGDLGHIMHASGVGATIELAAIPRSNALERQLSRRGRDLALRCLLAGGDDYELCFTAARSRDADVAAVARELGLELSRIGEITSVEGLVVRDETGKPMSGLPRGFDHFAA